MANQNVGDRKDRNGGGDVTKAEAMSAPVVEATKWDLFNAKGPGRTSEGE